MYYKIIDMKIGDIKDGKILLKLDAICKLDENIANRGIGRKANKVSDVPEKISMGIPLYIISICDPLLDIMRNLKYRSDISVQILPNCNMHVNIDDLEDVEVTFENMIIDVKERCIELLKEYYGYDVRSFARLLGVIGYVGDYMPTDIESW